MRLRPALFAVLLMAGTTAGAQEDAKAIFADRCSACHTVGDGDGAGPDLLPSTTWTAPKLREAVVRMQDNSGPMTDAEIDALVALLRDPNVKQKLVAEPAPAPTEPAFHVSAEDGRRLFYGDTRLAQGGVPCFGCHTVEGRGGSNASDLTMVYTRRSEPALITAISAPPFPMMKAAYGKKLVTGHEAAHIVAFLKHAALEPAARKEKPAVLFGTAGGFAAVVLGLVFFIFRSRRAGERSRLLRDSNRRS